MLYYSYYFFENYSQRRKNIMKNYQAFYLKNESNFRKTHQCTVGFLDRKRKWSIPRDGYTSIHLAENEFSGLHREAHRRRWRTLLCTTRRDTRPMLRTFPFGKLKYYPASCGVLILQSHSRKEWSYCGRDLPQTENTCISAKTGWLWLMNYMWLIVFHKAQSM